MDASQARKKASALLAHALDPSTTDEEARSHFATAKKLILRHKLGRVELLEADVEDDGPLDGVVTPDLVGLGRDLVDLVSTFKKSGLGDSLRRVVSSSKRAARSTGARRRRGL